MHVFQNLLKMLHLLSIAIKIMMPHATRMTGLIGNTGFNAVIINNGFNGYYVYNLF
jgi:hypothetical protein